MASWAPATPMKVRLLASTFQSAFSAPLSSSMHVHDQQHHSSCGQGGTWWTCEDLPTGWAGVQVRLQLRQGHQDGCDRTFSVPMQGRTQRTPWKPRLSPVRAVPPRSTERAAVSKSIKTVTHTRIANFEGASVSRLPEKHAALRFVQADLWDHQHCMPRCCHAENCTVITKPAGCAIQLLQPRLHF